MKTESQFKSSDPTLIRFDWAIKRLLRNKANYVVLEGFLSVLLNDDITIIHITESESNQQQANDKYNRVDIMVENSNRELLIVEVQTSYEADYYLRMLYGVSKAITDHLVKGNRYDKVRKVHHINIVYFKLGDGDDYVYTSGNDFTGYHTGKILQLTPEQKRFFVRRKRKNAKQVRDLFPEYYILCVHDFNDNAKDSLDEWIYYLKNNAIPEKFTARGLPEARELLQYDLLSVEQKRDYDHHIDQTLYEQNIIEDSYEKGMFRGEAIGLEKGESIGLEKAAINSHLAGYSIDTIITITGLTREQIIEIFDRHGYDVR